MKLLLALSTVLAFTACATAEPSFRSQDDRLEAEAQHYERVATSLEVRGSNPLSTGYREKAAEARAKKRSQPTIGNAVAEAVINSVIDFAIFGGKQGQPPSSK